MKLNLESIKDKAQWEKSGIALPKYDVEQIAKNTLERPTWVHFGAGNIFRAFIARIGQTILNEGLADTGIIAVDTFDYEIIDKIYNPFDNLTILVKLFADGNMEKEVLASVPYAYKANSDFKEYENIVKAFENPSLQIVSFTITEKGYTLKTMTGEYMGIVEEDIKNGPDNAKHVMSIVCSLLLKRFNSGKYPIAICSMDNCSHNGEKLGNAVKDIAVKWCENGFVSQEFVDYICDESVVSFPWSMIDKITPKPAPEIEEVLAKDGVEDMAPIITSKSTYVAPFVNAEVPEYLVMEDNFPNGRPALDKGGAYITDRETVNKVETMKVTTCLNPLHTALSVFGCVLNYNRVFEMMKQPMFRVYAEKIGYDEGMKVVVDPKIINPKAFIDEVINERLPNPGIPDDPQRIATDTSQKMGIRFCETIKSYMKSDELDHKDLVYIPLAIAGWLRYLLPVDDNGNPREIDPDPLKDELCEIMAPIKLGGEYKGEAIKILSNKNIFGIDLVEVGLSDKIEGMFKEMIAGVGATEKTLKKYVGV